MFLGFLTSAPQSSKKTNPKASHAGIVIALIGALYVFSQLPRQSFPDVGPQTAHQLLDIIEDEAAKGPPAPVEIYELVQEGLRKLRARQIPSVDELTALRLFVEQSAEIEALLKELTEFLLGITRDTKQKQQVSGIPQGYSPIKMLRRAGKLTLSQLSNRSGVAVSTISSLETGKLMKVKRETWEKIAQGIESALEKEVDPRWLETEHNKFYGI